MPKKILVVDDEEDIVEMLKYNLEREGYDVLTASTGTMALEEARKHPRSHFAGHHDAGNGWLERSQAIEA
ncbi:MAG: hypothetical protein ACE5H0_11660 [Bacteroidota bacterium]